MEGGRCVGRLLDSLPTSSAGCWNANNVDLRCLAVAKRGPESLVIIVKPLTIQLAVAVYGVRILLFNGKIKPPSRSARYMLWPEGSMHAGSHLVNRRANQQPATVTSNQ